MGMGDTMTEKRLDWVDVAKGIAMLSIVIGHVNGGIIGDTDLSFVYGYELSVFFVLAGYLLKIEPLTARYLEKKFKRLMVPYFFTCFFMMSFQIIRFDRTIMEVTSRIRYWISISFFASGGVSNIGNISFEGFVGAIWFLPAMFFSLIIAQIVFNVFPVDYVRFFIIFLIYVLGIISKDFLWLPFSIEPAMTAVFFIACGYWIKKYGILNKKINYYISVFGFIVGVYFSWDNYYIVGAYYRDAVMSLIIGVCGAIMIFGISKVLPDVKFFSFVGENSLLFLCAHIFVLDTSMDLVDKVRYWSRIPDDYALWVHVFVHIVIESLAVLLVLKIKSYISSLHSKAKRLISNSDRNPEIDVMRGMLLVIMILGHFNIDGELRKLIFSFHMAAFVVLSGFFFNGRRGIVETFKKLLKSFMLPYLLFCLIHFLLNFKDVKDNIWGYLKFYCLGISFSNKVFSDVKSVGPVYFILMLFLVRILYLIMDKFIQDLIAKNVLVFSCSYIGVLLGLKGYWLPWSFDIALYMLIFYHLGVLIRKYPILSFIINNKWLFFPLSCIWAWMSYCYSMEIAIRQYEPYGIVIIGAMSGIMVFYLFSYFVANNCIVFSKVFSCIGRYTVYVIICHDLFSPILYQFLVRVRGKNPDSIFFLIRTCAYQIVIGILMGYFIKKIMSVCISLLPQNKKRLEN